MTETNSKHSIIMTIDSYRFHIKEYKICGSIKTAEVATFTNQRELCNLGIGCKKINAITMIDKSRLSEINMILNSNMHTGPSIVVIEGISLGNCIITDYEICGSEDDYIYKVSLTLCSVQ